MSAIATSELRIRFGSRMAVGGVTFSVERGEIFSLLGPNGAGKSTLIRALCGLYRPAGASAAVLGRDPWAEGRSVRPLIGYMPQRLSLYGELTVAENVRFHASLYGVGESKRVDAVCRELGLDRWRDARIDGLSPGVCQRAALAAAIVHDPQLVFLDEPTAGVDPLVRRELWDLLRRRARTGATFVVTTHAMAEAELCDRLALMADGRLLAVGPPAQVTASTGLTMLAVESERWQEAFRRLRARWPETALRGRRSHVPAAADAAVARAELLDVLEGLPLTRVTESPPSLEDAFLWYVDRAQQAAAAR